MKRGILLACVAIFATACGISQQQEVQMGQEYAQQINAQLPIVSDPEVNRYINVLGDSLAHLTKRSDLDWRFYIVDAPEVNAFAVPGGFVYVNRGLIQRATNMSELAGVLGHEIGHVVKRHSVQQMEKAQGANVGVSLLCVLTSVCNSGVANAAINIGGSAVFAKFSRNDESEADIEGFEYVMRAGISPEGIVSMFRKLIDERETRPSNVSAWFATHPLEEDRIAAVQARINQIPPATLARLTDDSKNFQAFKTRLVSLPKTPTPSQAR